MGYNFSMTIKPIVHNKELKRINKMKIHIITTGGTIEGLEHESLGQFQTKSPMPITELMKKLEIPYDYIVKSIFFKDSRFITNEDRQILISEISKIKEDKILITHGTLTMVQTVQYIGLYNLDKTIVLTGAFILGTDPNSDAVANLNFAMEAFEDLKNGTYIAMHNQVFNWDNVLKNVSENRFERIIKS